MLKTGVYLKCQTITKKTNDMNYTDLNANEIKVLKSIVHSAEEASGGTWTDAEYTQAPEGISKNQMSGYFSQLVQKGYIERINEPGEMTDGMIYHSDPQKSLTEYKF